MALRWCWLNADGELPLCCPSFEGHVGIAAASHRLPQPLLYAICTSPLLRLLLLASCHSPCSSPAATPLPPSSHLPAPPPAPHMRPHLTSCHSPRTSLSPPSHLPATAPAPHLRPHLLLLDTLVSLLLRLAPMRTVSIPDGRLCPSPPDNPALLSLPMGQPLRAAALLLSGPACQMAVGISRPALQLRLHSLAVPSPGCAACCGARGCGRGCCHNCCRHRASAAAGSAGVSDSWLQQLFLLPVDWGGKLRCSQVGGSSLGGSPLGRGCLTEGGRGSLRRLHCRQPLALGLPTAGMAAPAGSAAATSWAAKGLTPHRHSASLRAPCAKRHTQPRSLRSGGRPGSHSLTIHAFMDHQSMNINMKTGTEMHIPAPGPHLIKSTCWGQRGLPGLGCPADSAGRRGASGGRAPAPGGVRGREMATSSVISVILQAEDDSPGLQGSTRVGQPTWVKPRERLHRLAEGRSAQAARHPAGQRGHWGDGGCSLGQWGNGSGVRQLQAGSTFPGWTAGVKEAARGKGQLHVCT